MGRLENGAGELGARGTSKDALDLVLVVDDDAAMLRSVARMLRQLGYASLLFPSAGTFANHSDFDNAVCVLLDINLGVVSKRLDRRCPSST